MNRHASLQIASSKKRQVYVSFIQKEIARVNASGLL
jgi:hypothetical protein